MMEADPLDTAAIVVRKDYPDNGRSRSWGSGCPTSPVGPVAGPVQASETAWRRAAEVSPGFLQEIRQVHSSLVPNNQEARRKISRFQCKAKEPLRRPAAHHPIQTHAIRYPLPESAPFSCGTTR